VEIKRKFVINYQWMFGIQKLLTHDLSEMVRLLP